MGAFLTGAGSSSSSSSGSLGFSSFFFSAFFSSLGFSSFFLKIRTRSLVVVKSKATSIAQNSLLLLLGLSDNLRERNLADNGRNFVLASNRGEPTGQVGVRCAGSGVEDELEKVEESREDGDVGKGNRLADEVGAGKENVVEVTEDPLGVLGSLGRGLMVEPKSSTFVSNWFARSPNTHALVLGNPSEDRVGPGSLDGHDLGFGEREVLHHLGGLLGVLAEQPAVGLGSSS